MRSVLNYATPTLNPIGRTCRASVAATISTRPTPLESESRMPLFVFDRDAVNRRDGDVTVVHLPETGLRTRALTRLRI